MIEVKTGQAQTSQEQGYTWLLDAERCVECGTVLKLLYPAEPRDNRDKSGTAEELCQMCLDKEKWHTNEDIINLLEATQ